MASRAVAVDLGRHSVKVIAVKAGKHGLAVTDFAAFPAEEAGDGLRGCGIALKSAVVGVGGRDMILRYTQVPPSPDWQLKNLMELELQDLASQSGGELSADYNLLPVVDEEGGMDTVLMALARNQALDEAAALVAGAGGSVEAHVPTCIAVYNAYLRCGTPADEDQVTCIAHFGQESSDIVLVRGSELLFARNLSTGGKVLDDAIGGAFNVSQRKAEKLKIDLLDLDPTSRGKFASGQAEKVTMAAGGASSAIVSGIQSSLAFCQSQTKIADLRIDRVLVSGGTARTRGLKGMLREALRCPVEAFDPFERCDLTGLSEADAEQLREMRLEAVVALGLAAGRVDDELYHLEILPERVKRRQRFQQRTVFDILAGAVAAGLLALLFVTGKDRLAEAETQARIVDRRVKAVRSTHDEAEAVAESVARRRAVVAALADRAVPLDGTLRVLRALKETLRPELWIESVEVRSKTPERTPGGRRPEPRTVITVQGKGKEVSGAEVGEVYRDFSLQFRQHPLMQQTLVEPSSKPGTGGITEFTMDVDVRPEPAAESGE